MPAGTLASAAAIFCATSPGVRPSAEGWSVSERALLEAADELHERQNISDEVWKKLAADYSDKQLVEILFVVGQYTMLSMFVNSSGVELEPGYEPLPKLATEK